MQGTSSSLDFVQGSDNELQYLNINNLTNLNFLCCINNKLKILNINNLNKLNKISCDENINIICDNNDLIKNIVCYDKKYNKFSINNKNILSQEELNNKLNYLI